MKKPTDIFNVLLLTPWLRIGGEERSTLSIAKGLRKRGHKVTVMSTAGPLLDVYKRNRVRVVSANVDKRSPLGFVKGVKDVRAFVLQNKIQIIHSQAVVPTLMAYFACHSLGEVKPKIIWHCRGIKNSSYGWVGRCFNFMTDLVIANSRYEMNRLIRNGLMPEHVKVIHNCANIDFPANFYKTPNRHPVVATVSRLAPQKGIEFFLEAAREVSDKISDVHFKVVGDGPLKEKLQQQAADLGLNGKVEFSGFKKDLNQVYTAMDILVFPSLWESFGNVAVEAAFYGVPVVASNVGGIPEAVVDGETGVLVQPGKADKLARTILELLDDSKRSARMGWAGRERAGKYFTARRLITGIEETYEDLVGQSV